MGVINTVISHIGEWREYCDYCSVLNNENVMLSHFTGALVGDRVRCPFHGACFNIKTGDIEEYPGLDCLPSYKVLTCFILIMQFNN